MFLRSMLVLVLLCGWASGRTVISTPNTWPITNPNEIYRVYITEPIVDNVTIGNTAQIEVFLEPGGSITGNVSLDDSATFIVRGGSVVGNVYVPLISVVDILSGSVQGSIHTKADGGFLFVRGGFVSGPLVQESSGNGITIFGRDFTLDGSPIAAGRYLRDQWVNGMLRGILADGSTLETMVTMAPLTHPIGYVELKLVPEPSSGAIVVCAFVVVAWWPGRKSRRDSSRNTKSSWRAASGRS